jgi:hypothetical protein
VIVAGQPEGWPFAILADEVAVLLRFVGVDGLDFVGGVGFGEVVVDVPKEFRRGLRLLLAVAQAVEAVGVGDGAAVG